MTERRGLIFLHIPKASGGTLRSIVRRQYPSRTIFEVESPSLAGLEGERARRTRVILGHVPFGCHAYLPVPADYITMLRDPVDRVVSLYYYLRGRPRSPINPLDREMSLSEFVACGHPQTVDHQTQQLSGRMGECGPESLVVARSNLVNHITCFGLHERFDESLILFRRRLGWRHIYYRRLNVTRARPPLREVPRDVVRMIERRNQLDIALFDFARRQFDDVLREAGDEFVAELRRFRRINPLYSRGSEAYEWAKGRLPSELRSALRELRGVRSLD